MSRSLFRHEIRARAACPKCKAPAGEKCVGRQGGRLHVERVWAVQGNRRLGIKPMAATAAPGPHRPAELTVADIIDEEDAT